MTSSAEAHERKRGETLLAVGRTALEVDSPGKPELKDPASLPSRAHSQEQCCGSFVTQKQTKGPAGLPGPNWEAALMQLGTTAGCLEVSRCLASGAVTRLLPYHHTSSSGHGCHGLRHREH
jgi:hypothetical protein